MSKIYINYVPTSAFSTVSAICKSSTNGYVVDTKDYSFFQGRMKHLRSERPYDYEKLVDSISTYSVLKGYNVTTDAEGNTLRKEAIHITYIIYHLNKAIVDMIIKEVNQDFNRAIIERNITKFQNML